MAPLPCSSFMMCVRTQPIAWEVPVQMTYQNLVMYRKCFMHCDILIYSYSSVSISQCNFGDSPQANFLFTGFIVQFAFYHCWLAPSPLLASILVSCHSSAKCFPVLWGCAQTIRHHHFYHKYAQASVLKDSDAI